MDDNTTLVGATSYTKLQEILQRTYNHIEEHLINLEMAINREKTQLTIMSNNKEEQNISIKAGDKIIQHQSSLKVLGFRFGENGKMDDFLWKGENSLVRGLKTKTSMLRIIKPYVNKEQLANIGNMVINSAILYAAPLWAQTGAGNINKIQVAQTKAARQILWCGRTKKDKITHRQDSLDQVGWLNVQQLLDMATINLVKKASKNESSTGINSMFSCNNNNNNKRTNEQNKVRTESTTKRKTTNILERGSSLFNSLPNNLRTKMSTHKFKFELKNHIKEHNHLPRNSPKKRKKQPTKPSQVWGLTNHPTTTSPPQLNM